LEGGKTGLFYEELLIIKFSRHRQ